MPNDLHNSLIGNLGRSYTSRTADYANSNVAGVQAMLDSWLVAMSVDMDSPSMTVFDSISPDTDTNQQDTGRENEVPVTSEAIPREQEREAEPRPRPRPTFPMRVELTRPLAWRYAREFVNRRSEGTTMPLEALQAMQTQVTIMTRHMQRSGLHMRGNRTSHAASELRRACTIAGWLDRDQARPLRNWIRTAQSRDRDPAQRSVSINDVFNDVWNLKSEFPKVEYLVNQRREGRGYLKQLIITTEHIYIDTEWGRLDIGDLEINYVTDGGYFVNGGPNSNPVDNHCHPHIDNGGGVCLGEADLINRNATTQGRIFDLIFNLNRLLHTYNPDSPFVSAERWTGNEGYVRCYECETRFHPEDEGHYCGSCDRNLCDDCGVHCVGCDRWLCSNCGSMRTDAIDNIRYCQNCMATCTNCRGRFNRTNMEGRRNGSRICTRCVETQRQEASRQAAQAGTEEGGEGSGTGSDSNGADDNNGRERLEDLVARLRDNPLVHSAQQRNAQALRLFPGAIPLVAALDNDISSDEMSQVLADVMGQVDLHAALWDLRGRILRD